MCLYVMGADARVELAPPRAWTWWLSRLSYLRYVEGVLSAETARSSFFSFGKKFEEPENTTPHCYILMTLLFSHFSTFFWKVMLTPAIYIPTTRNIGLLTPLKEQLLDYHSTINLAGCSKLLHFYRFVSIKYKMLVTPYIPHCLPLRA